MSQVDAYLDTHSAPHDLDVFLRAAAQVLHGASPYAFHADQTYAYPPLLAWLVALLHPLGAGAATLVWTLLSLAAIATALALLGVRDWRCYALAAVFLFTRSAVDLGTVAPFLLLAVAAAWRWRDHVVEPAVAVGAAIALKLFLWPLVLWLALTRRLRAAAAAAAAAALLVLVPWAVLGFKGIGGYFGVLRQLSRAEASSSYSVVALSVRAHLPQGAGIALSLVIAAVLLAGAAWAARTDRVSFRDREVAVLTLALAAVLAAFAASPIVWIHYFLLLLVPVALTQPRLSLVWFVPFAYYRLGEAAWPAGDARKLGLALAATVALLVFAMVHSIGRGPRLRLRLGPAADDARGREPAGVKTTSA